jgi:hypothetical protein
LTFRQFVQPLVWIDGTPMPANIEPYRWRIFDQAFERDAAMIGFLFNLILTGRGKKNAKTLDLILASLFALMDDSPGGNQGYLVANDQGQAGDDLELAKKLIRINPILQDWVTLRKNVIERRDGNGFIEVLPGQDALGAHGKTFRLLAIDEIHGARNWDLLEALAPDPTRSDCQTWIASYATLLHRQGVPLFDLMKTGKAGTDPRMLFSWYAADYCTDPAFKDSAPEDRANPSRASWQNVDYLDQQRRRLPAHKFRRLHLNLPGSPEGSAYQAEMIMGAVDRGVTVRRPERGIGYTAFVDMSGGSSDDAVIAIGHCDLDGVGVLDRVLDQGTRPPFDPRAAVERFVAVLREYRVGTVTGDAYAGETFRADFERHGIGYELSDRSKSEIYEAFEPLLNSHRVRLIDVAMVEQQLLGLVWRGSKIDHPGSEHDDFANACAGVLVAVAGDGDEMPLMLVGSDSYREWEASQQARGGWPEAQPDDDGDDEVIEATEEEMAARSDAADWVRTDMTPRRERQKRHHDGMLTTVARDGYWDPRDE